MAGNFNLPTENINEVILRLLAYEPNEIAELDYETYKNDLREILVEITSSKRKIGEGELNFVKDEFKRVRGKKGRFRIKKTKISATGLGLGGIRKQISGTQKRMMLAPSGGVPQQIQQDVQKSPLLKISETLDSVLATLINLNEQSRKEREKKRLDDERKKRGERESGLESKTFEGLKKAVSAVTKPFQSIFDKIINFIFYTLLGKVVIKLIDWFANPENQKKIQSLVRFFKDHWPTLLALYLRFGTGLGRFIGGLSKFLIKGAIKIGAITAQLALKAGLGKAGGKLAKVAGFLGGPRGKLLGAVGGIAANVAMTAAGSSAIEGFADGDLKVPGFSGGGWNKGFGSVGNFFGNMFSGLVKGPGGSKGDKIPALLSNGEFVVSAGAVQKYGVDTFEAMNAAGGGTNVPRIVDGVTYAAGGGLVGDIPLYSTYGANPNDNILRSAARAFRQYGTEEDLFKAFKKLNGVPDFEKMVGGENNFSRIFEGQHGADDALDAIRQSVADKIKAVNNPQSFTQSSRAAAGLDDLAKKFDMDAKTAPRYAENLPKLNRPKPQSRFRPGDFRRFSSLQNRFNYNPFRGQSSPLSPDYFLRGQSSPLRMTPPTPTSSAIVPYTGGGLARTGVTGGLSVPQIRTNMRVPGGFGNLKSLGVELLLSYLVQSGLDYVEAKRLASSIEKARKESPEKLANRIEKLRDLVDKEERFQKSFGGILQKVIAMGGETGSEVLSRQAKTILAGVGAKTYQGGAIKGGYGLKQQSFKDMPKTQIMTDDKGRPFVGYKAMRNGKPVYVRGPQPGQGTSNPFEALGRMINPGAYKDIDARNERKKYEEASRNSISSLKARGASQATIVKRQAELKKGVKPLPKPKPRPKPYVAAGGGMNGARGSRGGNTQKAPSPSPRHSAGTRTTERTTGTKR